MAKKIVPTPKPKPRLNHPERPTVSKVPAGFANTKPLPMVVRSKKGNMFK